MRVRSVSRPKAACDRQLPGVCEVLFKSVGHVGKVSRLEEVRAARRARPGKGGRNEGQVGRAHCSYRFACARVGRNELALQAPLWGQLSLPVLGLPSEPEVASRVLIGERAELRQLVCRLADGDRAAFRPAFAVLWPRLRAFAARYVGGPDGEDAAQSALLRVFSRASEYDPERDALSWALGIAAWECRTLRSKRKRRKEEALSGVDRVDPGATPEDAAIQSDLRAAAEAVMGDLRPLDLETIVALAGGPRAVQGATFRKRLERALARFRIAWRAKHGSE